MKNNFLILFLLLILGIYFGSLKVGSVSLLLLLFLMVVFFLVVVSYRGYSIKPWLLWFTILLGTTIIGRFNMISKQAWVNPHEGTFEGKVYSVQKLGFEQRVLVKLVPTKQRIAVHLPLEAHLRTGDKLVFTGFISQPQRAANPGVFCYQSYLFERGVYGVSSPTEYHLQVSGSSNLIDLIRNKISTNIRNHVQDPSLLLALIIGERGELSSERNETWRKLGISHLLAISGMHVGFLALGLGFFVRKLSLRPLFSLLLTQLFLWLYIIIASSGPSAWRALLATIFSGYAGLKRSRLDPLHVWSLVGSLLLLVQPHLAFNSGFCLSFAASGGIILWSNTFKIKSKNKIVGYILSSLLVSLIAQLSLVPLLIHYFGEISLLAPLTTLLFAPLIVVLLLGGFGVALGLGAVGLGLFINWVMHIVHFLENLLIQFSWQWRPNIWGAFELTLYWFFFLYAGWRLRRPRITRPKASYFHLITCFVVLMFITSLPAVLHKPLEVTAVNVGQGDCYYIRTPSGRSILIDGGGDSPYWQKVGKNVGKERLLPYLEYRGVKKLDYVILSHPHEDHLFGLLAVLENLDVGMIIDNGHAHNTPTYEKYLDLISEKNTPHYMAKKGDDIYLGDGITMRVLYPESVRTNIPSAHNNNSLLLLLTYGGIRMMFTGDLEKAVLQDLANDFTLDLQAHLLKVPHHGSDGSLVEEFYDRVNPKWAMISVGSNSFGHPGESVCKFLNERQINWQTTLDGPKTFEVWWGLWGRFKPSSS
ncbi:MAG: DNA internalization-related competence protein ComEC/Rec2 [Bacillota bacterium]|nr:DNA internalization-related competence protein ComEC/Rec2 [Bacillota bacterium]